MSTKNVMKNNSIKISGRESFQNSRNPRDIRSPTKKVSFFNPIPEKSPNGRYLGDSKNINEEDTDEYNNSNLSSESYDEDREKQLEIVNEKFQNLFLSKERIYGNIIKEINAEKKLFFKKSIMSFNLLILKIKCYIKLLKKKFVASFTTKEYYELDSYILKIKKDFKNLSNFIDVDSKYEYEITTQVYAKFLYLMGIISSKKEEYITSFSYISLGVNILKVFFIRQGVAKYIETYQIYAKLVVMLINKLISDNNVTQSLFYINFLTHICEISLTLVSKKNLHLKYEGKFNKYLSYGFLYLGYCYELNPKFPNNIKEALKSYKEAFYFLNKTPNKPSIFSELSSIITIEKKAIYLAQILFEKLTEKLTLEALEKQKEFEHQEMIKKQKLEEARNEEKKYRLKLIACGVSPENQNLMKVQEKLFWEILTPNNQILIDKLDDELISYVYRNKRIKKTENEEQNKEKKEKKEKKEEKEIKERNSKMPSMSVMKTLCHYKMYNNLMSDDYKDFLLNSKRLYFNCPTRQKNTLDKIQKYLNRKMEIGNSVNNNNNKTEINNNNKTEINNENKNKITIDKDNRSSVIKSEVDNNVNISLDSNRIVNKLYNNIKNNDNNVITETNKNSIDDQNINMNNIKLIIPEHNNKKNLYRTYRQPKHSYIISKEKDLTEKNMNLDLTNHSPKNKPLTAIRKVKIKAKNEPENKKVDKFTFNKKYFRQYMYFDNLINKELLFQKTFLLQKNANSKMFLKRYQTELDSQGIVPREEILNTFLIINDKVTSKERNYEKEMKLDIDFKSKPKILGGMYKSVSTKLREGKKMKNAMGKVLDKYLMQQRKANAKKKKPFDRKEINRKNELSILKFNDNIKQINYLLTSKSNEMQNLKKTNLKKNIYERNYTQE